MGHVCGYLHARHVRRRHFPQRLQQGAHARQLRRTDERVEILVGLACVPSLAAASAAASLRLACAAAVRLALSAAAVRLAVAAAA